jgi:hypothetical protein
VPALLDPGIPHPTDRSRGRPTRTPPRDTGNGQAHPFEVLDRSFGLLVCAPAPLALDGRAVGHGLPARRSRWMSRAVCCCTLRSGSTPATLP